MNIVAIFLIAIALSMDAFAVALCKGLAMRKINYTRCTIIALFFGVFQFIMPIIGWFLSLHFQTYIASVNHWVIFLILSLIGIKMMYESFQPNCEALEQEEHFSIRELSILAIGTSIDALAVGISFALFSGKSILFSALLIGVVTVCFSFLGVILGNTCGQILGKKAEFAGGCILLYMGCKTVFEYVHGV